MVANPLAVGLVTVMVLLLNWLVWLVTMRGLVYEIVLVSSIIRVPELPKDYYCLFCFLVTTVTVFASELLFLVPKLIRC